VGLQVVSEVTEEAAEPQRGEELEEVAILQQMTTQGLKYEQKCEMEWVWMSLDQEEAALQVWAVNLTGVSSAKRKKER
jgi:hypothetical protein